MAYQGSLTGHSEVGGQGEFLVVRKGPNRCWNSGSYQNYTSLCVKETMFCLYICIYIYIYTVYPWYMCISVYLYIYIRIYIYRYVGIRDLTIYSPTVGTLT